MRRFLLLVVAALLPLQLAVATAVPARSAHGAEGQGAQASAWTAAAHAAVCSDRMTPAAHHGAAGHQGCPHSTLIFIAIPCVVPAVAGVPDRPPVAAPVAFDSLVLDVPLPPPTAPD